MSSNLNDVFLYKFSKSLLHEFESTSSRINFSDKHRITNILNGLVGFTSNPDLLEKLIAGQLLSEFIEHIEQQFALYMDKFSEPLRNKFRILTDYLHAKNKEAKTTNSDINLFEIFRKFSDIFEATFKIEEIEALKFDLYNCLPVYDKNTKKENILPHPFVLFQEDDETYKIRTIKNPPSNISSQHLILTSDHFSPEQQKLIVYAGELLIVREGDNPVMLGLNKTGSLHHLIERNRQVYRPNWWVNSCIDFYLFDYPHDYLKTYERLGEHSLADLINYNDEAITPQILSIVKTR